MHEGVARLVESLREQKRLYERMLQLVARQETVDPSQTQDLLAIVSEHREISTHAETVGREAAARKKAVDADALVTSDERALLAHEVQEVQQVLQHLIQSQQAGMDRLLGERDQVARRIQKLSQGRRALSAYGGGRGHPSRS